MNYYAMNLVAKLNETFFFFYHLHEKLLACLEDLRGGGGERSNSVKYDLLYCYTKGGKSKSDSE